MHDTLLKFFESKERYGVIVDEAKWLTRVCINRSIDQLRKNRAEKVQYFDNLEELMQMHEKGEKEQKGGRDEQEEVHFDFVERVCARKKREIREAILGLPPGYRLIITLIHFEGYDYEEIAQITGISESTARSQYLRAKKALAERLKEKKRVL